MSFSSKNKYQDLPIQIFTLEKNGHLLNLTADDDYNFHGTPSKIAIIGTRNPAKDSTRIANQIAKFIGKNVFQSRKNASSSQFA